MDGEVVDALFCLFDQGVPIHFPGQGLWLPVDLFQGLIYGDCANGDGEFRMIHSRVSWMLAPVERSITVSEPQ